MIDKTMRSLFYILFCLIGMAFSAACAQPPSPTPLPTAAPFPSPTPEPSLPTGRIAFITPSGQLATIAPDGTAERTLTSGETFYQFPAWSPTSNQIAVIAGGGRGAEQGVFVLADEDESTAVPLFTTGTPIYLYWSPNGQRVSFIANHPRGLALHIAPADGQAASDVLTTGQPLYWQWLADNEQALTHASSGVLAYVDVTGMVNPLPLGGDGFFQAPALSADGRYLAYSDKAADESDGGRALFVYDNEPAQTLHQSRHLGVLAMSWSPTAAQLAYTSPTENRPTSFGPLQLYDVATGASTVLVAERVLAFFWSPDGRQIAYLAVSNENNQQAKVGEQAKAAVQPIQQTDEIYLTLNVLEVATGGIRPLYTFQPTRLFVNQFLPYFDQYALSHRLWSPDSQFVVLPVQGEATSEIVVVPIDGRAPIPVAAGLSAFWSYE
ncbi:MAG: hypothetical protein OT477_02645 [Chloroflexi bacterium]|nr:hypothetical protein [Chloroflexota bacterium]